MSNEKSKNHSDKPQGKNSDIGKTKNQQIGENQSKQDIIRKGAEITPRPPKPETNNPNKEKK